MCCRQEDAIYEDALIDADGAAQFDFRSELSTSKKGLLMATSPTDLFMHSISPGYKVTH